MASPDRKNRVAFVVWDWRQVYFAKASNVITNNMAPIMEE